jgi:KaiC/GvpD/RAD55 family RecA-like ATPase
MSALTTESVKPNQAAADIASSYLLDFFATGGRSVLVRGDPGTGKTSMVLQLLDYHSKNGFKSIYMSTRLSAKTLKSHQPWVEVVQGKYGTVPRLGEDQIGFQDSRRTDGVRAVSGLRQYLEQISNPFVVLDSWEGLFFDSKTAGVEEISRLVEDYDARFVVVTERREQTDLDYLLDGVVVLRRKFHLGRVVREIELKKLRGVSINQSRFLFTLDQGKFRYLAPFDALKTESGITVGEAVSTSTPGIFSSGSRSFDSMIGGGLKRSSFNLIEVSDDIPGVVTDIFLRTVFSNFINSGHRVIYVPFLGAQRSQLEAILPNISKDSMDRSVSQFNFFDRREEGAEAKSGLEGSFENDFRTIYDTMFRLSKESAKPVLAVFSQDAIEGFYGAESIARFLPKSIALFKNLESICVQISSSASSFVQELRAFCDVNVRLEMIHDTPVAYSIRPPSVLHSLSSDPGASGKMALTPIV